MTLSNANFTRSVKRWWECIDNLSIALLLSIIIIGCILITTASPAVAERIKIPSFYFAHRQFMFLLIGSLLMVVISFLEFKALKKFVLLGFTLCIIMLVMVLFIGEEVKGSKRWISLLGITLQPSELIKPFYIFMSGLLLSEKYSRKDFPAFTICSIIHTTMVALLILQPDFGMVITFTTVLASQFFLAGISFWWISIVVVIGIIGAYSAYILLPHVAKRIDSFMNPEVTENYQVEKSLEAYINGSVFGQGPGEGTVKAHLPDSHTDFIFAVAGEEFGAIFSSLILIIYFILIARFIILLAKENNLHKIFAGGGIIVLFSLQTIFNVGVTLHIFPTKGMTLPFISYGGSSILCFSIAFGILLNITKQQHGIFSKKERELKVKLLKSHDYVK